MLWKVFDDMGECGEEDVRRMLGMVGEQRREKALKYKHVFGQWTCLKACELLLELIEDWRTAKGQCVSGENKEKEGNREGNRESVRGRDLESREWGGVLPDFEYNEYGKPFLRVLPDFSISHCKEAVIVAIADATHCDKTGTVAGTEHCDKTGDGGVVGDEFCDRLSGEACECMVGVDVETVREVNWGLVKRVMNEREQAQIRVAARPEEEFTRLWTQKEAVLKWRGTGIIGDLKEVLTERNGERLPKLTTWTGGGGRYVVTVAEG